ncbi:hypothetical protein AAGS40_18275 [Paraburkholderia sp. PREW-6R]|uniref:hypothetical protein n=1 Tax=Paraburkholderia sp. PREW-6R TaxID=3141544 RepID=UPI0031F57997
MDDRFDRRELLLHLGDMLDIASRLTKANAPDAPVRAIANKDETLRSHAFLQTLAPTMTVAGFARAVLATFAVWPEALLAAELDSNALALPVLRNLFDHNAEGWDAYLAHVQQKVEGFGAGVARAQIGATAATTQAAEQAPALNTAQEQAGEKRGWPWPARN